MTDIRPIKPRFKTDIQYHEYMCCECGETAQNTHCEPYRTTMLERRLCFTCNHWRDVEDRPKREHTRMTIIGGNVYTPGNRTSGMFRGMAGRRFDIEYISPSIYAGKRITTFDLWSGSIMPDKLKQRFCDTARFLGGAAHVKVGDTGCWNPSNGSSDAYPLPQELGIK